MKRSAPGWGIAIALFVAVGIGCAGASSVAFAASTDEAAFIRYKGTVTLEFPAFGKRVEPRTGEADVEIRCGPDDGCRLGGVTPEGFREGSADGIPIVLADGRAEVVQTPAGEPCSVKGPADLAGTLTVLANARAITVTWTVPSAVCPEEEEPGGEPLLDAPEIEPMQPPLEVPSQPLIPVPGVWMGTAPATVSAAAPEPLPNVVEQTWVADFVEGDGCLVEASACPTPSPSPAPVDPVPPIDPVPPAPGPPEPEPLPLPVPPAPEPTPTPVPPADPPSVDAESSSWSTPSVLSDLSPFARLDLDPVRLGACAVLAIVLVLLIAFPTARLNSAVERAADLRPKRPPRHLGGWWQAAVGVVIASLITGFVDPEFGWNVTSARVVATLMVALVIDVVIGWSARVWLMRRLYPRRPVTFRFVPVTLLIVAGAVVLSRILDFEPAIIFGLVAGIALSSALSLSEQARTELVAVGYGLVVSLAAWALYTALPNSPGDPVSLFAHETLSAAAIAGAASLPLILFPLRGLPGYAVFRWRLGVWAAVYSLALFVFAVILMPMPESWAEVRLPLATWTIVYVLYCAVAVVASKIVDRMEAARPSAA